MCVYPPPKPAYHAAFADNAASHVSVPWVGCVTCCHAQGGDLIVFNDKLFFGGTDEAHGVELWSSDGTSTGTEFLKDLRTGVCCVNGPKIGPVRASHVHTGPSSTLARSVCASVFASVSVTKCVPPSPALSVRTVLLRHLG